jgi:20S proteasome alpha/beta subunit
MTVCIAAICEGGDAIVLASDRFRWHPTAAIEAELDDPKFYFLSDSLALMGSGSSSTIEDVLRHFRAMPSNLNLSTVEAAARFQDACQASRTRQIETLYSKRFLGLKFEDFKAVVASGNPGSIALDLYNKTLNYDFGSILIVAGIDQDGPHVHLVDDGADVSHTEIGYSAIGTGGVLACVALARRAHRKSASLPEAIYNVYEAKKTAEMAKGVGITTDISVIRRGQSKLDLATSAIDCLGNIYERMRLPVISEADIKAIDASMGH